MIIKIRVNPATLMWMRTSTIRHHIRKATNVPNSRTGTLRCLLMHVALWPQNLKGKRSGAHLLCPWRHCIASEQQSCSTPSALICASAAEVNAQLELMRNDWQLFNTVHAQLEGQQRDEMEESMNLNAFSNTAALYRRALASCNARLEIIAKLALRQQQSAITNVDNTGLSQSMTRPETLSSSSPFSANELAGIVAQGPLEDWFRQQNATTSAAASGAANHVAPEPRGPNVPPANGTLSAGADQGAAALPLNGAAPPGGEAGGYWRFPISRFPETSFNGDRTQWVTFKSRVATMQYYTAVDRYHKLLSMLTGEATAVLDGVTVTNDLEYQRACPSRKNG